MGFSGVSDYISINVQFFLALGGICNFKNMLNLAGEIHVSIE